MNIDDFLDSQGSSVQEAAPEVDIASVDDPNADTLTRIDMLVAAVNSNIIAGDGQHALDHFTRLQSLARNISKDNETQYDKLSSTIVDTKTRLAKVLVDLKADFKKKSDEVYALLTQTKLTVEHGDVAKAVGLYVQIRKLYETLPNGFSEQRAKVQDDILKVFLLLKTTKETKDSQTSKSLSEQIPKVYQQAAKALMLGDVDTAKKHYEQMSELYVGLPEGYIENKSNLFEYMSAIYNQLILATDIVRLKKEFSATVKTMPKVSQVVLPAGPQAKIPARPVQQKAGTQQSQTPHTDSLRAHLEKKGEAPVKSNPDMDSLKTMSQGSVPLRFPRSGTKDTRLEDEAEIQDMQLYIDKLAEKVVKLGNKK
ncbi:MAG: hypothetical protein ACI8Y7_000509 [Candidatus Woesearchaeota archaeon]|jgi:hypothetical protein